MDDKETSSGEARQGGRSREQTRLNATISAQFKGDPLCQVKIVPPAIVSGVDVLPDVDAFEWECNPGHFICGVQTMNYEPSPFNFNKDFSGTSGAFFKCCPGNPDP